MSNIFINYRREDTSWVATSLNRALRERYSKAQLFMDVEGHIGPGDKWKNVLADQVAQCDVLLALIGPTWLDVRDETGSRRLDNPDDFVRYEIDQALQRGIRVIPVLVDGAEIPPPDELPESLQGLFDHNVVNLRQAQFGADGAALTKSLSRIVPPKRGRMRPVGLAVILIVCGLAAYGGWQFWGAGGSAPSVSETQSGPSESMIREAQSILMELGYNPGDPDGKFGLQTRDAIIDFQRDMGTTSRKIFGQVDDRLLGALRTAKRARKLADLRKDREAKAEALRSQRRAANAKQTSPEPLQPLPRSISIGGAWHVRLAELQSASIIPDYAEFLILGVVLDVSEKGVLVGLPAKWSGSAVLGNNAGLPEARAVKVTPPDSVRLALQTGSLVFIAPTDPAEPSGTWSIKYTAGSDKEVSEKD